MDGDARVTKGTILVVDDEELVRTVAKLMIERLGYSVLVAVDGQSAVEVFLERGDTISAVLLDMTMPRLGGLETLRALRGVDARVPVILTSGYGEQDASGRFENLGLVGFLQKPFQLPTLREMLERALESGR